MPERLVALLSMVFSLAASGDAAIRPDSLIFNQTYPLVAGVVTELPLYLTRRGEYYVEVILERADGSERPEAVTVDLNVKIERDDKLLLERAVSTELGRTRPAATLFWFTSDRELPLKTPLTLAVQIGAVETATHGETLRLQVKRKLNRVRLY